MNINGLRFDYESHTIFADDEKQTYGRKRIELWSAKTMAQHDQSASVWSR